MVFKKKEETKPEADKPEIKPEEPKVDPLEDEGKKALEAKLAEAQAKIAELEKAAASAKLVDEPDPEFHILLHTRFKGDHVKLINGKTVEFVNSYARIPRSDKTTYELLKKTKLWGSEYIEVNRMEIKPSGPGVQTGPLTTLRGKPQGGS